MDSDGGTVSVESELVGRVVVLLAVLAVWLGIAITANVGRTVFLVGVLCVGGGYLLLRLVHAVERLAVAAERLAKNGTEPSR